MRLTAGTLLLVTGACIPDWGDGRDAAADAPLGSVQPVAEGGQTTPGVDAMSGGPDVQTTNCGTPDLTFEVQAGPATEYTPDKLEAPVGKCLRLCVTGSGERHTNNSDNDLFPRFSTGSGERICETFRHTLQPKATPYRLFCEEHKDMNLFLTAK